MLYSCEDSWLLHSRKWNHVNLWIYAQQKLGLLYFWFKPWPWLDLEHSCLVLSSFIDEIVCWEFSKVYTNWIWNWRDQANSKLPDWQKRIDIIRGVAKGLLYLHEKSRLRIIYRDLKASNILLDNNLNPKFWTLVGLAMSFGGD
jgi:hypothetical protein